ncbi:TPA: hypothetical protein QCN85_006110, partial [Bacillus anthracis]|nr:hypothetical protein [Bacillus anthracis]
TPLIEVTNGQDGTTTIVFKDPETGEPVGDSVVVKNGQDGQDGQSITVTSTSQDANGNTIITFSDGTTVVLPKGQDGKDGQDG